MRQGCTSAAATGRRVNSKSKRGGGSGKSLHAIALAAGAAAAVVAGSGSVARAVDYTWANTGTDWNTPINWGASAVNFPQTNLDAALFSAARTSHPDISTSVTIARLAFTSAGSGYTITASPGQSLTLTATSGTNAIANATGLANGILAPIIFSPSVAAAQLISNSSANGNVPTLTLLGPITATAVNGVRIVGATTAITSVTNASNNFSGGLTLNVGKLSVGNNSALGASGNISFTGGTLQYGSGITQDFSSRIVSSTSAVAIDTNGNAVTFSTPLPNTNTGGLSLPLQGSNGGSLTLAVANNFIGNVNVTSNSTLFSALNIQNAQALGPATNVLNVAGAGAGIVDNTSAGPLSIANGLTLGGNMTFPGTQALTIGGPVTISGAGAFNRSITVNGAPITLNGNVSNGSGSTGRLSKGGNGTMTLSGDNSTLVGVNLNGGRLNINSAAALGSGSFAATGVGVSFDNITGSPLTVANGISGFDWTFVGSSNLTFNGTSDVGVGGSGAGATHTATLGGTNRTLTLAGALSNTVTDATVSTANVSGASGNTLVVGGAKLNSATSVGMTFGGNGNVFVNGPVTDGAQPTGNLAVSGGTWTLNAANNYTGTTTVNSGRLQTVSAAALPGYNALGKVTVNSGGTLGVNAGAPSGQWTDSQINDLYANATLNSGSNLAIDTTGGDFSYGFAMAKANGLVKLGANTLTLPTANTYGGPTTVSAGTLALANADATAGGAIDVKDGALAQAQAGLLKAVTVTTLATSTSGKFDITNNSMVIKGMTAAQVKAEIVKAYNAGAWNGAGGLTSSTAAAATIGTTGIGYALNSDLGTLTTFKGVTGLTATDVLVKYTYFGDADLDGDVDGNDVGNWAGNFTGSGGSTTKTWFQGDWDYDGDVDGNDVGLWAGNFTGSGGGILSLPNAQPGAIAALEAMGFTVVPEPTGLGLLGLAGTGLLGRRRHRTS